MCDKRIAVIDAETDPFAPGTVDIKPFVWGFYDGEQYLEFWNTYINGKEIPDCTEKLFDFLETCEHEYIIYAHNGGKFDFHFFFHKIPPLTPLKVINGRVAKVEIGRHEFRDSYSLLPVPLGAYKKDDIDYNLMRCGVRMDKDVKPIISDYLDGDCRYLFELVNGFINKFGLHLTMATASMKQWEKMAGCSAPVSSKKFYNRFSEFYYGGRVQCFEMGIIDDIEFDFMDINSAYPAAMLCPHPLGTDYMVIENPSARAVKKYLGREYMGNLFFNICAVSKGALPWRAKDKRLYYPDDDVVREYAVTGWEIKAALETNALDIKKINYLYEFDIAQCDTFENYILHFYDERMKARKAGDEAMTLFCKLFMNSLYGKFGANPDEYRNFMNIPPDMINALLFGPVTPDEIEFYQANDLDDWMLGGQSDGLVIAEKPLDDSEQRFFNVATAASITGYVRAFLWRAISTAERPLYCDTDSVAALKFSGMKISDKLGDWDYVSKSEKTGEPLKFNFAALAGRKLYAMRDVEGDWKKASKGVKLSERQIIAAANGESVTYHPLAPTFSIKRPPVQTPRTVTRRDRATPLE